MIIYFFLQRHIFLGTHEAPMPTSHTTGRMILTSCDTLLNSADESRSCITFPEKSSVSKCTPHIIVLYNITILHIVFEIEFGIFHKYFIRLLVDYDAGAGDKGMSMIYLESRYLHRKGERLIPS